MKIRLEINEIVTRKTGKTRAVFPQKINWQPLGRLKKKKKKDSKLLQLMPQKYKGSLETTMNN